jgi:SMC interacting uncharacterized protein involved in chromosome segregation
MRKKEEKREELKRRIVKQLRGKVRPHRSPVKVLDVAIVLTEEQIETLTDRKEELEWELEYLKKLDPKELEPETKS